MKSFTEFREACWTGYKAIGTKRKGGRRVPNCVPVTETAAWNEKGIRMKSFKSYIIEEEADNHPDFISQKVSTIGYQKGKPDVPLVTTTRYSNGETGVHSAMHTHAKTGSAYWGYSVSDKEGKSTDSRPEGVSAELRRARSRTAMGHLVDFAKRNPQTPITYQTNDGPQGERNHQFFQKRWAELQKTHGLNNTLTRVEKNPLRT